VTPQSDAFDTVVLKSFSICGQQMFVHSIHPGTIEWAKPEKGMAHFAVPHDTLRDVQMDHSPRQLDSGIGPFE
jgi:hypothetical protein